MRTFLDADQSGETGRTAVALAAYRFPHGDAPSNRLLQLARSATPVGGTTVVVNDWPPDGTLPPTTPDLPADVRLINLLPTGGGRWRRWWRRRTRSRRMLRALRAAGISPRHVDAVHLPLGLWDLATWAVLRAGLRCPITVDVTERHDPAQFAGGRLGPGFLRHRWAFFLAGRLADRVIAITHALERHFVRAGRATLVVPPQIDVTAFAEPRPASLDSGLRLLYAGSPTKKDQLGVVIAGILSLPPGPRARIHLVIAGMTRATAVRTSDLTAEHLDEIGDGITFLGRVSRDDVLAELSRSHFSVLVRPPAGYAQFGFPSKVPESLAAGCPVLLNHTSDLARHVVDGDEGIVLGGCEAGDVRAGLERALQLDDPGWQRMSAAARRRADDFDYRRWRPAVSSFVIGDPAQSVDAPPVDRRLSRS
ncbi:glycosyltransferase [Micromonospora sp. WMMD1128]|uniref:glycosyltransferase n=1 Tax=Micromonospora sp. WMMD1128 TaxID=3015150 RepID=UPI00248B90CC|nr:glycosyltransferase [Micromonospora sp. WMMD1128]WBB71733.1 glycosyltransferase [Micromonospora sp. WMMD1128]